MSGDCTDFKKMQNELQSALDILDSRRPELSRSISAQASNAEYLPISETDSLLERCRQVANTRSTVGKPTVRVIHHLACSGGSLISKCIASLPNVFLLSEVHPDTTLHMWHDRPQYLPSDISTLSRYAKVPEVDILAREIFQQNIRSTEAHIRRLGGTLVLRDHSHADYFVGKDVQGKSLVVDVLGDHFDFLRVVTIRNPVDSYLSLVNNNWEHYTPKGFEEYCKRYLAFTSEYSHKQILKYEDFVDKPKKFLKKIARMLELPFSESFLDSFDTIDITGDSGRSGADIAKRERRALSSEEYNNICSSKAYKKILRKFNYSLPQAPE